jgi:hypothetical protein
MRASGWSARVRLRFRTPAEARPSSRRRLGPAERVQTRVRARAQPTQARRAGLRLAGTRLAERPAQPARPRLRRPGRRRWVTLRAGRWAARQAGKQATRQPPKPVPAHSTEEPGRSTVAAVQAVVRPERPRTARPEPRVPRSSECPRKRTPLHPTPEREPPPQARPTPERRSEATQARGPPRPEPEVRAERPSPPMEPERQQVRRAVARKERQAGGSTTKPPARPARIAHPMRGRALQELPRRRRAAPVRRPGALVGRPTKGRAQPPAGNPARANPMSARSERNSSEGFPTSVRARSVREPVEQPGRPEHPTRAPPPARRAVPNHPPRERRGRVLLPIRARAAQRRLVRWSLDALALAVPTSRRRRRSGS